MLYPSTDLAQFHGIVFVFRLFYSFHDCFRISNFFGPSTTEEKLVEMRIWCITIGIILVLHFHPWVEASAGALQVLEGLYGPVAKYFGACLKIQI
jgi:hypothetical protein